MSAVLEAPGGAAAAAPGGARTLPGLLLRRAAESPQDAALREKHLGLWRETSWARYAERAAHVGLGLLALGVEPGDRIAVQAENRPEWLLADLGAQGVGAVVTGVYPTSPAAELEYQLGHAEAVVLVAEDEEQFDKAMAVRDRLPALRAVVVVDPRGISGIGDDPTVLTWAELERLGAGADRAEWDARVAALDPAATAIVVYTSGTTGPPKGAMISHANLVAAADAFLSAYDVGPRDEVLSYLPLSHIAERLFSVVDAIAAGYTVNFGEGGASFAQDLRDVQPTFFLGVPRVWEKMMASVEIRMADASRAKRALHRAGARGGAAGRLVHRPLREKLGLSRCRVALSGAAPIAPQVLEYFTALGVPIREGYGQTENTAICTYTPADDIRVGTVGRALPGVELRLADDGEVLTRSPGVFQGYLKDPAATAQTIDADGWLHTGDVGVLDPDGILTITDRKKDIIITAGGKNVSPSEIENRLKVSPYVREAVVVGDQRKYLVALIGIEADTVGDWASRRSLPFTTYADLASKDEVRELVAGVVEEVNRDLAQVETIKRFALLTKELDHEDGELTATQKVKRRAIEQEFGTEIEALYA